MATLVLECWGGPLDGAHLEHDSDEFRKTIGDLNNRVLHSYEFDGACLRFNESFPLEIRGQLNEFDYFHSAPMTGGPLAGIEWPHNEVEQYHRICDMSTDLVWEYAFDYFAKQLDYVTTFPLKEKPYLP